MEYLHGTSFDAAREELEASGMVYSNAVLDGEEYFYSMYRMENAEWTLVFLVNASAVAMNTVELVNTTVIVVMTFAVLMTCVCAGFIFWMQRRQQKKEMAIAGRTTPSWNGSTPSWCPPTRPKANSSPTCPTTSAPP